jgi:hypothetical protein
MTLKILYLSFSFFILSVVNAQNIDLKKAKYLYVEYQGTPYKILLASDKVARKLDNNKRNCYAFSTHSKRHTPGGIKNSPVERPYNVNKKNLKKALKMDKGIPLGTGPKLKYLSKATFDKKSGNKDQDVYLLIAGFITWEEYHFIGAFEGGWWNKPSKVGKATRLTDSFKKPSLGIYNRLKKLGKGAKPFSNMGFYLMPYKPQYD